ncbi:MAG: 1-acyl-sn-glycerol-3-phosphate acyltransferase [Clostridia bacterium]|nr:1-acyl-sn-glycerol-3-phosphate acyltransferase [Clostridia bacterium]
MKKEQSGTKVRKPSFFLYTFPVIVASWYFRLKWRIKIDRKQMRHVKGPILCLANHGSTIDAVISQIALFPRRYNIVTGKDLFTWKSLRPFIQRYGAIPKNQCTIDLSAMRAMKSAIESGNNVIIYPEGRTSLDGKGLPMTTGIGKFVKFLDATVVILHTDGSYMTHPRYFGGSRKGRVYARVYPLFSQEEVRQKSPKEIYEEVAKALEFNDHVYQKENKIRYKSKEPAKNLNYILYKCPKCGAEYENVVEDGRVLRCKACGNAVEYTEYGDLLPKDDSVGFERVDLWYDYEKQSCAEELEREDFRFDKEVKLLIPNGSEFVERGRGRLVIADGRISYCGTKDGEEIELFQDLKTLNTIVTKNTEGVDLTFDEVIHRFLFVEGKWSVKCCHLVEAYYSKYGKK